MSIVPVDKGVQNKCVCFILSHTCSPLSLRFLLCPRQVLEHRTYDEKADVFSFGITMW